MTNERLDEIAQEHSGHWIAMTGNMYDRRGIGSSLANAVLNMGHDKHEDDRMVAFGSCTIESHGVMWDTALGHASYGDLRRWVDTKKESN